MADRELIVWRGGAHRFRLGLGELRRLQRNCNAGPEQVFNRLRGGAWMIDDLIEPIRLGLIGSGEMTESEAGPEVTKILEQYPPVELKLTAAEILARAIFGHPEDEGDEDEGPLAGAEAGTESPGDGISPGSTETGPS